ncbi:Integron-associated effector binding protein [Meiothermus taiwanensis]|uniref:Integron-associated effector binding protein n=2 Tax=Meiothermus taiwanensis TaxID=172827 RepID=A0A399DTR4_9DEIN|nr:Integron-associated effector binding protein [Meiothermus taiwanensis]
MFRHREALWLVLHAVWSQTRSPGHNECMERPVHTLESGFFVAGYELRTSLALEQDPQTARIPPLWHKIESGALELLIPKRRARGKPFVVYFNYESEQGPFSVLLGYQVMGPDDVPPGLSGLNVPGGRYLMFSVPSAKPDSVKEAWQQVRAYFRQPGAPKRAFTFDYEVYENTQRVSLFVAIQ